MTATIPLAKGYNPAKLNFPVLVSEKIDGVPIKVTATSDGNAVTYRAETRQGEPVPSVSTVLWDFMQANSWAMLPLVGEHTFIFEVAQHGDVYAPFKDTSGMVRKQQDMEYALHLWMFDYSWSGGDVAYADRMNAAQAAFVPTTHSSIVEFYVIHDEELLEKYWQIYTHNDPQIEGLIARSHDDHSKPGTRSWGYQKLLNEPTVDLRITGFEEAIDKDGNPKGMVGRVIAEYKGGEIGVGPGKLTHKERTDLWKEFMSGEYDLAGHQIAQIKYKKDDSYEALRQPTFQCWRPDKTEADA